MRIAVAICWSSLACVHVAAVAQTVEPPAVEHHLHIRSLAGAEVSARLATEPGGMEPVAKTAADALSALDAAGIECALVLSIAYMFGMPDLEVADEYEKVRAENDYVAAEVAKAPDRLVGACSINPLADYALEEVERCAADSRLAALKLHLANSDVDLRDESHVATLANLFERLGDLGLPAVVHMRTRAEDYGATDATVFVERILSRAPHLPVLIAHMAGWGGYDEATDAALGVFVEAFADSRLDPKLVSFDLAAVVFQPEAAGDDAELEATVRANNERLAERIREIGLERVVFATDWPSWPPVPDENGRIAANMRLFEMALPLAPEELARVFANVSPVVGARPGVD